MERFDRIISLLGEAAFSKLQNSRVAVFGLGGVGSYVLEGIVRSGVTYIDVFDKDIVDVTNINRQILATEQTVGKAKTLVAADRALAINPNVKITPHTVFYTASNSADFDFSEYDYIVDAVDTVSSKIELIIRANEKNVPIISCMGTGNKLDATAFKVADIYSTNGCPLARVMRHELKKKGIKKLKVVYSPEKPIKEVERNSDSQKPPIPSAAFVPSVAGMIIAGEVVKDLIK